MAKPTINPNRWFIPKLEVRVTNSANQVTDGRKQALALAAIERKRARDLEKTRHNYKGQRCG